MPPPEHSLDTHSAFPPDSARPHFLLSPGHPRCSRPATPRALARPTPVLPPDHSLGTHSALSPAFARPLFLVLPAPAPWTHLDSLPGPARPPPLLPHGHHPSSRPATPLLQPRSPRFSGLSSSPSHAWHTRMLRLVAPVLLLSHLPCIHPHLDTPLAPTQPPPLFSLRCPCCLTVASAASAHSLYCSFPHSRYRLGWREPSVGSGATLKL